jgi:UDP-glucose 4-epimerase
MLDVVTGGAGFIGSHLVDRLVADGRRVRVVDSLVSGRTQNLEQHRETGRVELLVGDVCDEAVVERAFHGAERVFHLAGRADVVPSIEHPGAYFRTNVDGTFVTLQAARRNHVARYIYVASSSCYGIPDQVPTPETAPLQPQYPYALTKMLGEQLVLHWAQVYQLPAVSIRFFNVYGPRARTTGSYGAVFGVFLAQLRAGLPLTIVGDGTQTRDFTYVTDAVAALVAAAASDARGAVYNVGSNRPVSINRLVELLGAREVVHVPKRPGEPDCTWADTTKIRAELGWEPRVAFEDGVATMLEHIDSWRDAPVWTVDAIAAVTRDWFAHLGRAAG